MRGWAPLVNGMELLQLANVCEDNPLTYANVFVYTILICLLSPKQFNYFKQDFEVYKEQSKLFFDCINDRLLTY